MTEPYFTAHVFCCQNKRETPDPRGCCADKGANELRDYMKDACKQRGLKQVRVNMAGCLDRCLLGPVMVIYPEGVWYHYDTKEDIDAIIEQHLIHGTIVERLRLTNEQKKL